MKRFIVVLVVVAGIVTICAYSLHRVSDMKDNMDTYTNAIFASVEVQNPAATREGVQQLTEYWDREEYILIRFVRHAQVDEITKSVSKLDSLALHESWNELHAELNVIVWMVEHIWETEQVKLGNLL